MPIAAGEIIDAAEIADSVSAWQAYTPILYTQTGGTRASIAKTVTRAVWAVRADLVIAQVDLTAGATSTGGASVSLPVAAVARQVVCGSAGIMGASAPAQSGLAFMSAALDSIIVVTFTNGFTDIISGQTFRMSVVYQQP